MPKASSYLGFQSDYPTKTRCECASPLGSQDEDGDWSCVTCGRHLDPPRKASSQPPLKPYKATNGLRRTFTPPEQVRPLEAEASAQGTLF